jgi:acyl dehydratase
MPAQPVYLDDMKVGDRHTSAEHALDAAQIIALATQYDPQPFHLDDDAAKRRNLWCDAGTIFSK